MGGRTGVLLVLLLASPAAGQRLTLAEALGRADRDGYANRMADGAAEEQSAARTAALRGILPTVRLEGGYVRTTDPIGAFGITLQQRRIGPADFDPARLNRPAAVTNYGGAVVVEQPLLNADAHLGRQAARRAAEASRAAAEWTRGDTRVQVIESYYGVVLAREQVATLEAAVRAAREHVRRAESLVTHGLATGSDALLASVQAGELEARLIEARGRATAARSQLAMLLGTPGDTLAALPARLPDSPEIRDLPVDVQPALESRRDVAAARSGRAAAALDASRARSLYLPRLNAVARYDWNSATRPFEGDENWAVGVMLTWTPFAGGSAIAEQQATRGRAESARAGAEAVEAQAALEAEQSATDWAVALERLRIAETAVEQSAEAHRIVGRKYEGGLAAVVELLSAAATETQSALSLSHARYNAIVTAAVRLRALGHDPAVLTLLDRTMD
jgi:outer membrane protein TolC